MAAQQIGTAMPGSVTLAFQGAVAVVTIANPGRLNAIDDAVSNGLADAAAAVRARRDLAAMILRGAGREAFSAGVDLKFVGTHPNRADGFAKLGPGQERFAAEMAEMPLPVIAMLHGVCYGGGLNLALAADFRFADTALRLAIPAVKNGLLYPIPALERLMRLVGPSRTRRLVLEGAALPPQTLLDWGLLDELHAPDALEAQTFAFAERLAAQNRATIPAFMKIFRALDKGDVAEAQRLRAAHRRV